MKDKDDKMTIINFSDNNRFNRAQWWICNH